MNAKKIRILHVIKTLSLGGAETNLFNLVQAFDPDKYEIHVAYSFGGEIESRFRRCGVQLFKYAEGSHKLKSFYSLLILFRLARYILSQRIDIIHTHIFNAHIWGGLAGKLTGRKVVEHVHDFRYMDQAEFRRRRGTNTQYRHIGLFRRLSDRILILTQDNFRFIVGTKIAPASKVRQIQNGIPITPSAENAATRQAMRDKLGIPVQAKIVLTSARISEEKNVDLILRIAPAVLREVPNAVFLISGDGPLLAEFKEKVRLQGMERSVLFIGYYDNMNELLDFSDVFLLPSYLELHSIAVLEAMSRKVPVVISKDVGCNNEFIRDWENGVLLDPFSDRGWAGAVARLLKDPILNREIGVEGFQTVSQSFRVQQIAKKVEGLYDELLCG